MGTGFFIRLAWLTPLSSSAGKEGRGDRGFNNAQLRFGAIALVETVYQVTKGQIVTIDGKTVRRSHAKMLGKNAIHMVSAWASTNGIVLGQRKVDDKSNEITAIPELLCVLDVSGCTVTIDAMGCQKKIAQTILDEKADYVLSVKANQAQLHQDIQDWFAYGDQVNFENMESSYYETLNKGHGRIEIRRCWVVSDRLAFEHIRHHEGWAGLASIIRVQRERRQGKHIQVETAFYINYSGSHAQSLGD